MKRRSLLAAVAVGLAGCTGAGAGGDASDGASTDSPTPTPSPSPTPTPTPSPSPSPTPHGDPSTMADASLSPLQTCPDEIDVAFDDGPPAVCVRGCVTGRNGCARPTLADATYDPDADRLTVVVATVVETEEGTVCTQALTDLGYEVTVPFGSASLPGEVAVVHDDVDGRREVARVTR